MYGKSACPVLRGVGVQLETEETGASGAKAGGLETNILQFKGVPYLLEKNYENVNGEDLSGGVRSQVAFGVRR